jgi:hypothetical protein
MIRLVVKSIYLQTVLFLVLIPILWLMVFVLSDYDAVETNSYLFDYKYLYLGFYFIGIVSEFVHQLYLKKRENRKFE